MSSASKTEGRYQAPALEKGLGILELLAQAEGALSQVEIARELGRSPNELYRMLSVLEASQYVQRDQVSGKYRLTLKLFTLGRRINPVDECKRLAIPAMREYARTAGVECHLSILQNGRLVVIHEESGFSAVRVTVEAGSIHHPLHTLSGRLLLARLEAGERAEQLAHAALTWPDLPNDPLTDSAWQKLTASEVSWSHDEALEGVSDAALALPIGPHLTVALASATFHSFLTTDKQHLIAERLQGAAAAIQRAAGLTASNLST